MLLALSLACETDAGTDPSDVTVERLGPTVVRVTWESDDPGLGYVRFGQPGQPENETHREGEPTISHDIVVAGMTPSAAWELTAVTDVDGTHVLSTMATFDTEALPDLSGEVGGTDGEMQSSAYLLETTIGTESGLVMYDTLGRVVWGKDLDGFRGPRVRIDDAGTTLLVGAFGIDGTEEVALVLMGLDGVERKRLPMPNGHHDFAPIPEGYAYIALDARRMDGDVIVGDKIVEMDRDGNVLGTVWSSWDTWTPEPPMSAGFYDLGLDWTHCNSLDYLPATDQYLLSVHNLDAVVVIDRSTGDVTTQFGGKASTMELTGSKPHSRQHSPMLDGDELYMFDNGTGGVSEVRGFHVDAEAGTYAQTSAIPNPAGSAVQILGDVLRAADGHTLTSWGSSGLVAEFDSNGEENFRLDLALGTAFGFFQPIAVLGGPSPD